MEYEDYGTRVTEDCPECGDEGEVFREAPPKFLRCNDCEVKWQLLIDSPIDPDGELKG